MIHSCQCVSCDQAATVQYIAYCLQSMPVLCPFLMPSSKQILVLGAFCQVCSFGVGSGGLLVSGAAGPRGCKLNIVIKKYIYMVLLCSKNEIVEPNTRTLNT